MNNSVWRSTLVLSFASCYIMWGKSTFPWHSLVLIIFPITRPQRDTLGLSPPLQYTPPLK